MPFSVCRLLLLTTLQALSFYSSCCVCSLLPYFPIIMVSYSLGNVSQMNHSVSCLSHGILSQWKSRKLTNNAWPASLKRVQPFPSSVSHDQLCISSTGIPSLPDFRPRQNCVLRDFMWISHRHQELSPPSSPTPVSS